MKQLNKVLEAFRKDEKLKITLLKQGFSDGIFYETYNMKELPELLPDFTTEDIKATTRQNLFIIRLYLSKVHGLETTNEDLKELFRLIAEVDDRREVMFPNGKPEKEKTTIENLNQRALEFERRNR